jgi:hypothetical protein
LLCLEFVANNLKLSLLNHLVGKFFMLNQGSDKKQKSGEYSLSILFKTNFVGVLARPLAFQ